MNPYPINPNTSYVVRMHRLRLGMLYYLALWDEHPEQEPTLV